MDVLAKSEMSTCLDILTLTYISHVKCFSIYLHSSSEMFICFYAIQVIRVDYHKDPPFNSWSRPNTNESVGTSIGHFVMADPLWNKMLEKEVNTIQKSVSCGVDSQDY